jgi:hypothetical protein
MIDSPRGACCSLHSCSVPGYLFVLSITSFILSARVTSSSLLNHFIHASHAVPLKIDGDIQKPIALKCSRQFTAQRFLQQFCRLLPAHLYTGNCIMTPHPRTPETSLYQELLRKLNFLQVLCLYLTSVRYA